MGLDERYSVAVATAARKADITHGAQIAQALGWPADRVGFLGALGGLIDIGASMRHPRSVASLLVMRRAKQQRDIEARIRAGQDTFAMELARRRKTRGIRDTSGALTLSERRIAELAQGGCTNGEIGQALSISSKVVEFHLRNAYSKLGIRSRGELAQALRAGDEAEDHTEPVRTPHHQH